MAEPIVIKRMGKSDVGDRYTITLNVMGRIVRLYLLPSELAPLTKVDLTPDAPNPPRWPEPCEGEL
jgi:hypothetical protein